MPSRALRSLVVMAVGSAIAGCWLGNVDLPPLLDDRVILLAALNPDSPDHPILVMPVDAGSTLKSPVVTIHQAYETESGTEWVLVAVARDPVTGHSYPCTHTYHASGQDGECLMPSAALEAGATYRVMVTSDEHASAWGVTRAVGDFSVDTARLSVSDSAKVLSASWSKSVAAHRYVVSLRRYQNPDVFRQPVGWYLMVDGTSVTTVVPEDAIEKAVKPLILDVAALDEHLYAYITTGNDGGIFPVMPVQNVEGGFGFVGSMRFRKRPVEEVR